MDKRARILSPPESWKKLKIKGGGLLVLVSIKGGGSVS